MATTSEITNKRAALAQAQRALIDTLWEFELARDALRTARRTLTGDDLAELESDLNTKQGAFEDARTAESTLSAELLSLVANWLPMPDSSGEGPSDEQAAAQEVARLEATSPVVLLPIRLETRFDGSVLRVRVYPDEIFLDSHETALTPEEQDAGRHYYDVLNNENNEKELWRDIVARFGVQRSAYILRQMLPIFGSGSSTSQWLQSSISCGGTVFGGNHEELLYPLVQSRSSSWTRPGRAVLPDRWAFVTYRNGQRQVKLGNLIPEPLAMTVDPKLREEGDLAPLNGDYAIDDSILWTVDFTRALEVGMAIEIDDASAGFDRLIVVGVKSSLGSSDTSLHLERLLDAHHYTRGLAIVRQGSPTNNTDGQTTPYPPRENAGQFSYGIERQRAPLDRDFAHHCLPHDADGHHLAMALGVPSGVMANVDRAYSHEIEHARSMNEVLWPGTFGYYLRHLMFMWNQSEVNLFTPTRIADAKRYFRNHVLARGPAPAFRVGGTPYGVLPITALRLWEPRDYVGGDLIPAGEEAKMAAIENGIRRPLLSLLEVWKQGAKEVPRIRTDQSNPDLDVASVLSTYPSSREFRVRMGESESVKWARHHFLGIDISALFQQFDQLTNDTFGMIGYPNWRPRLGRTEFAPQASLYTGEVIAPVLSEDQGLPNPNFISGIRNAGLMNLNQNVNVNGQPANPNLLYSVLRHSTLMEYWRQHSEVHALNWVGFDIFGIPSILLGPLVSPIYESPPNINSHLLALDQIAFESTAELERLFTESLDLASHRLDAWLTAFATRRLDDMRRAQIAQQLKPKGDFLGGYGWLEDLRPRTRDTEVLDGVGTVEKQAGNGGFIHAPSMSHASAAAVLRNGHISFKHENPAAYAIDLSSKRVRKGRRLFQAVRNGQPVGALLGYELERALEDDYGNVPGVHQLRFTLRALFPLVANKNGQDADEPAESIAARNVVDGSLLLRQAQPENGGLPYGMHGLPSVGNALHGILEFEIARLAELYDATADLLTAEGVFQLVRGNMDAAVPTINNVAEGIQPPDTIVSKSARGGLGIAHKVALVFADGAKPQLPAGWPTDPTPRAKAEPTLNAWVGQLLGNPEQVTAVVTYLDDEGELITITDEATSTVRESAEVRLSELDLHPLDVLALAEAVAQQNQGAMLDRRIVDVALADPARQPDEPPARIHVSYASGSPRTIPELFEVLNTASGVLGASRPLAPRDLVPPAEIDELLAETDAEDAPTDELAVAFRARAVEARTTLSTLNDELQAALTSGSGYRALLKRAAAFEPLSAYPDPALNDDALRPATEASQRELARRLAAVPATVAEDAPRSALIDWGNRAFKALFGGSFLALPELSPPRSDELSRSLESRTSLLTLEAAPGGSAVVDDEAPDRYLHQIMRSRDRLGRFRKLNLYARTLGLPRPRVDIVQLPHEPGEKWLGLPYQTAPEEGRAALLLLNYAPALDATEAWTGLVLDDWSEIIPNQKEETGIAFHYDSPRAQAPQAVLVATPAKAGASWSFEELLGALEQTITLMKVRAVDRDFLPIGQILPATVFATNEDVANVVSTAVAPLAQPMDAQGLEDG